MIETDTELKLVTEKLNAKYMALAELLQQEASLISGIAQLKITIIPLPNIPDKDLSPRENQILSLLAKGYSNKEIAAQCLIADATVKAHMRTILQKLHVRNRVEAVAKISRM